MQKLENQKPKQKRGDYILDVEELKSVCGVCVHPGGILNEKWRTLSPVHI